MAQEDTKQEQVNPADELKKAAEAAEQAQGSELPPELGIEPEGEQASLEEQLAAATAKAAENFDLYVRAVAEMETCAAVPPKTFPRRRSSASRSLPRTCFR